MRKRKIFAGIALVIGVSLMAPICVPDVLVNSVVAAEEEELIAVELAESGSFPCENGETLEYTFVDGVLTISGKGDKLVDRKVFSFNRTIKKVVFTDDCTLENMDYMFDRCYALKTVENIPGTVTDMLHAFSCTGLTEVPELPENIRGLDYTFDSCGGITEVDFTKFPSTVYNFMSTFSNTNVTNVTITFDNMEEKDSTTMEFDYCFSGCTKLKTMVIDCTNLTTDKLLSLGGICRDCTALESFELINTPENHIMPGARFAGNMFANCENLVSVKNEGYFEFCCDWIFKNCKKLKTIETKGFVNLVSNDDLDKAFLNCETLEGTYYIQLSENSGFYQAFYKNVGLLEETKEKLKYTFKGCSDKVTFYVGCKPLVDYCNELKTQEEYKFDANVVYWEEGDTYKNSNSTPMEEPVVTATPEVPTESAVVLETTKTPTGGTVVPEATKIPTGSAVVPEVTETPKVAMTPRPAATVPPTVAPITDTTVTKLTASVSKKKKVILRWKKKSNVNGYQIYKKTGSGKFKLAKTIKKAGTTKWTDTSVKIGKTYRYKIRAYKIVKKKKTYSKFSTVKKVIVK